MSLATPFLPLNDISTMEIVRSPHHVILAVPFALSGVAVTAALTRCGSRIGLLCAFDLVGAAIGCALVVPILEVEHQLCRVSRRCGARRLAYAFAKFAGITGRLKSVRARHRADLRGALQHGHERVAASDLSEEQEHVALECRQRETHWNSHSYVLLQRPGTDTAFLWGPGKGENSARRWVDGHRRRAGRRSQWDGNPDSSRMGQLRVTTLLLDRHGNIGVIGVGGGRDLLAALWEPQPVDHRDRRQRIMVSFSGRLAASVREHRESAAGEAGPTTAGRASRGGGKTDIIQMSLVTRWASTRRRVHAVGERALHLDAWLCSSASSRRRVCSASRAGSIRTTCRRPAVCSR